MRSVLFANKQEKQRVKDNKLMKEFGDLMLEDGQKAIDALINKYADALGMVDNFEDAKEALLAAFDSDSVENIANIIDEIRFAAQGIGSSHG